MTLRKITIDNSVRYIPKGEQTRENEKKYDKGEINSWKAKKIFHKTIKNSLIMWQQNDLPYLNEF